MGSFLAVVQRVHTARARFGRMRLLVWGGLLAVLAAAALWPYAFLFEDFAGATVLGAALVGYLPRRRFGDALLLAVSAAAVGWIEPGTSTRVLAVVALPCFVFTLRPRFSVALAVSLMALLLAGIHLKLRFAGSRLSWQDLRFFFVEFHDNATVFQTQPTLLLYSGLIVAALAVLLCWAWAKDTRTQSSSVHGGARAAAAVLAAIVVAMSARAVADEALRLRKLGPWLNGTLAATADFPLAQFLQTATLRTAWVEPTVSATRFAGDVHRRMHAAGAQRPADIVLFLQESQFNPATVQGCPVEACTLPIFAADRATRAYGPLRVYTFGGGTWLSEFTVATGVPHTAFGEGGAFAPFTIAPGVRRSFPRSLRNAGYRTVAIYPIPGGMMDARNAYRAYGFDAFYDSDDLGIAGGYRATDQTMHAAALRVLERERAHGKPVLLMVSTIFNHAEHGVHLERVPPALLAGMRSSLHERHAADVLADYVWRTGEFQSAMRRTEQALLGGTQPVVLAWFGDHQPPNARELSVRPADGGGRAPARLQTWYRVSSNLPGAADAAAPTPLDISFLPGVLAEAAGVPLDEMLAANVVAREQCGGLLRECERPEVRESYLSFLRQDLQAYALP